MDGPRAGESVKMVDNATGEAPRLATGDMLIMLGPARRVPVADQRGQVGEEWRQLCEVRRPLPLEEAEAAAYDAIESLRGRIEALTVSGRSSRLRAQRLRQAATLVTAAIGDLARAIEQPERVEDRDA